jgi:hypothetical protein
MVLADAPHVSSNSLACRLVSAFRAKTGTADNACRSGDMRPSNPVESRSNLHVAKLNAATSQETWTGTFHFVFVSCSSARFRDNAGHEAPGVPGILPTLQLAQGLPLLRARVHADERMVGPMRNTDVRFARFVPYGLSSCPSGLAAKLRSFTTLKRRSNHVIKPYAPFGSIECAPDLS